MTFQINQMNNLDEIEEYKNRCWDKVYEYKRGVDDGSIITDIYIPPVLEWFINSNKYEIKTKKIDRVFRFFSLIHVYDDRVKKVKQIELLPWEAYYLAMLFGMYDIGTNKRRFDTAFTFIARGNGKSPLGIGIALYFELGYNQINPQAVILTTATNATKLVRDMTMIVTNSPELYQYLHYNNNAIVLNTEGTVIKAKNREIIRVQNFGSIQVLPADGKIDGPEIVLAFIDEIHELRNGNAYYSARRSADKRADSLLMLMTTAGVRTEGFCVELVDRSKKIALGEIEDERFLPFLYCLDKDDNVEDYGNKTLWHKCNPSLGTLKYMSSMEAGYKRSLYDPNEKAVFLTKDLNVFIDYNEYEVVGAEDYNKAINIIDLEKWKGKDCYLGLDLSKSNDLSSLVAMFHDEENNIWEYQPYFWVGNDSKLFKRKSGVNIIDWCKNGFITVCPEKTIDYNMIVDKIDELSKEYNLIGIGYDNYAYNLFRRLFELKNVNAGVEFEVKQWGDFMAAPLSDILISFLKGKTIFSKNPVMRWNWKNVRIRQDKSGNLKIWKNESKDSVDGAVAMNDAMALYYHINFDPKIRSFG